MTEPQLNVIALISGGKDSFYSLLHVRRNGGRVVALANLYPGPEKGNVDELQKERGDALLGNEAHEVYTEIVPGSGVSGNELPGNTAPNENTNHEEVEYDLNSFMYQTVGHTIIPLYEQALGILLYRQQILGGAVQNDTVYSPSSLDETESLIPLLTRIMKAHPEANAISTGAILSIYQRTRVESVALRLGLTPLGFLWKYPILPPNDPGSLLRDMGEIGLDARVVKVASGGLDEGFLWENVADSKVKGRIERAMKRFGSEDDGAVLGEGGEFETLVVDGPDSLFKGRIFVEEGDREVIREGGGAAWLRIKKARVEMKDELRESEGVECRVPDLLDQKFERILSELGKAKEATKEESVVIATSESKPIQLTSTLKDPHTLHFALSPSNSTLTLSVTHQTQDIISQINTLLTTHNLSSISIIHTTILLRSMSDFTTINKVRVP
jgi:diphthine-ammonia ligase